MIKERKHNEENKSRISRIRIFQQRSFTRLLLSVLDEFHISKVMSSNPEKVKSDLEDVEVVSTLSELLEDDSIDLVIITTPSGMHYEMVKDALRAGKHVIVEKSRWSYRKKKQMN